MGAPEIPPTVDSGRVRTVDVVDVAVAAEATDAWEVLDTVRVGEK